MSLQLTTADVLDPAARLSLGPGEQQLSAPTAIQMELFHPDRSDVPAILKQSLDSLFGAEPETARLDILQDDVGVTALDGTYARYAARAVRYAPQRDAGTAGMTPWHRLLYLTRHLGQHVYGLHTELQAVEDGPVPILAAGDQEPTVAVHLEDVLALKSNQRAAIVRYLVGLTPGVDVRLIGSQLTQRQFLAKHRRDLPASTVERAEQRLHGDRAATRTAQTRQQALDALEDLGLDHPDWERLQTIATTPQQRRSYSALGADPCIDLDREGVRVGFAKRMRDHDLVETLSAQNDTQLVLTTVGLVALQEHPDLTLEADSDGSSVSAGGWDTEHTGETSESPDSGATDHRVATPPNSQHRTVLPQTADEGGEDRPAAEGDAAVAGGTSDAAGRDLDTDWLSLAEHHATAAAAEPGGTALVSRDFDTSGTNIDERFSYDEDRKEIVVRAETASVMALTGVRLCKALASDKAFNHVLTQANLDGGPGQSGLEGLPVSEPVVLRDGACLGYLATEDATGSKYRRRLMEARNELLAMTEGIDCSDLDAEHAGDVLQAAQGLFGTLVRVYDLLGWDVVVQLRTPAWLTSSPESRDALAHFMAKATAVSSRHGVYSANRILWEPREAKREQTVCTPDIDADDPVGTTNPSWVLVGPDVDQLQEDLTFDEYLSLQEDGQHFSAFCLEETIVDGDRREAWAETAARIMSFKTDLEETRQSIAVLRAFLEDVFDGAAALMRLNGDEENGQRDLRLNDLRTALALWGRDSPERICADVGPASVSRAIHALLDADRALSSSELAAATDVSTQTLRNNAEYFDALEAAGLLDREQPNPGGATQWRLTFPFDDEQYQSSRPAPDVLVGEEWQVEGLEALPVEQVFEVFVTISDEYGHDLGINWGGSLVLDVFAPPLGKDIQRFIDSLRRFGGVATLVVTLLDVEREQECGLDAVTARDMSLGADPSPTSTQTPLDRAVAN